MKKRIIAFLLCFALVMPILPTFAVATEDLTLSATSVTLPQYEKKTITAAPGANVQVSAYQWQIKVPGTDLWVDISGAEGDTLELSYAMIASLLQGDQAQIRCEAVIGGATVETDIVTVTMDYTSEPAVETESEPVKPQILTEATVVESSVSAPASDAKQEETIEEGADLAALEEARNAAIAAENAAEAAVTAAQEKLTAAQTAEAAAKAALDQAQADYDAAVAAAAPAETEAEDPTGESTEAAPAVTVDSTALDAAKAAYADAQAVTAAAQKKLDEAAAALTAAQTNTSAAQAALDAATPSTPILARFAARNVDDGIMTADAGDVPTQNYSILINYVFADGKQAANPWSATLAAGSDYAATIVSPTIVGYAPDLVEVEVNVTEIADNKTITVIYNPALVEYTVKHYQQNLNDDNYTLVKEESKQGYTESPVGGGQEKDYTGFYSLLYDTTTAIAADGSTEVEIYYDRYYYLMTFDLDGGYGVEPIYARYGAPVSAGTPTKAGYTFTGWSPEMTYTTMPATNTKFTAQWTAGNTTYDVVFWYENADDDLYSQAGVLEDVSAVAGSIVNGSIYQSHNFTGRDSSHFTYSHADENVEVKGDGTTVVNVYFSRNVYTLTFVAYGVCGLEEHTHANCTLSCGMIEHKHSHNDCCTKTGSHRYCNVEKCPNNKEEHAHSDSCYSCGINEHTHVYNCNRSNKENTVKVITAKYEADIQDYWPIKNSAGFDGTGYWWDDDGNTVFEEYTVSLDSMPGANIIFNGSYMGKDAKIYYYVQNLAGDTSGRQYNGKYYTLYKTVTTVGSGYLTREEEFHDIPGFTQGEFYPSNIFNDVQPENYLYYTRNSYELSFSNAGSLVSDRGGSVQFEASLTSYNFTPDYPSTFEPDAYVFEGWYESPFFGDTKVNFETAKMPANDVTLYARWVPKNHNVNIYRTSEMNADDKIGETQVVVHRELAEAPEQPENGAYTFVGWFYMDGSTEKAFDFSMPVTQDLNLYAKWSSNTLMEYTIHYELENGTKISEDTIGSALAGTTKTFEAKTGEDLYEDYQSGYFPNTNSHSLTIDIEDPSKNEFTFIYVPKDELPYKVMYLEYDGNYVYDGTEKVLHDAKNAKTSNAVITEKFEPVTGYKPDAYQKRLVLSADETQNVIIFWYVVDNNHAPVQIIHYIQNAVGDGYTEYQSSTDLNGVINDSYSADVLNITGYDYDHATANSTAVAAVDGKVTGTVTPNGLILELFYNREMHPYEFKFLEQVTGEALADSVTGTARYGSQVTQNAKDITGYQLVSDKSQAITIQIEDGDTAVNNVRIFYYTEQEVIINYEVFGPAGCGTVTPESETLKVRTGEAAGSTATASTNIYKFVGWYDNETCEGEALSTDEKYVPTKEANKLWIDGTTYYAKFEYNLTDLTISKTADKTYDEQDTFIFEVYHGDSQITTVTLKAGQSINITGVTVGDSYTVKEIGGGSNRYTTSASVITKEIAVNKAENNFAFTNKLEKTQWLTATDVKHNVFG